MIKQTIIIPGASHLDTFRALVESQFPVGSFILDKKLTGCGATTMFLRDSIYTILVCPRILLMDCKANDPEFKGLVHEFRKADDRTSSVFDLQNQMMDYIRQIELKQINPFTQETNYKAPKILVSYDSFKHVAQRLAQEGILERFRIVVDEFQTLMTDAAYRGPVEMEFMLNVQHSNNVIYLSATPCLEKYLDQLTAFQNLPLVELEWPKEAYHTANIQSLPYYRQSLHKTASRIIQRYFNEGCFERKMYRGQEYEAKEALFFLNDVKQVISIINDNGLTPANTNVLCARTDENYTRIAKIEDAAGNKLGFTIGHAPKKDEPHKPFPFVTRCSFEGVDFYSTNAYTYIFSDINLKHLGLDLWIEVPQILGRQRREDNPFRFDATFYYKTLASSITKSDSEFIAEMNDKVAVTNEWIDTYNQSSKLLQDDMAGALRKLQKIDNCATNYVSVSDDKVDGTRVVGFNELAMYNEIRAWDMRQSQYLNSCQVMTVIDQTTYTVVDNPVVKTFLQSFGGCFEDCMKLYCNTIAAHPECKDLLDYLPQVPIEIKRYYNALGPDVIKSCSYIEARILRMMNTTANTMRLKDATSAVFVPKQFYSLKQVKSILEGIYQNLGIKKTAKASDLQSMDWLSCKPAQAWIDGHKENGYRIL